jgi:hypothetical protein
MQAAATPGKDWAKNALTDAYALGLFSQFSGTGAVDTEKLLVPDAEGKAVGAGSSCPRECFCSLASYGASAPRRPVVRAGAASHRPVVRVRIPCITAADAAALDTLPATLGSNGFGLFGTAGLRCISVAGGTAVLTGTVTSSAAALRIAAGGTGVVTRYDSTMPIRLEAPASGLRPGSEVSFALQTATTAGTMTAAAGFTTVSSEQAGGAVSYSDAVSGAVIQADKLTSSGGRVAVSVSDSAALGFAVTNTPTQGAAQNWEDQNEGTVNQSLLDITRSTVLAATAQYLVFNETVTLNEAGSPIKTLSGAEAKAYCIAHPGITAVSMHGIVISLENDDPSAGKFPDTVLYFGASVNDTDSNSEPCWQIQVCGDGRFKPVNLKKLIAFGADGKPITTEATADNSPNTILADYNFAIAKTGAGKDIYVLHFDADDNRNLVAYCFVPGSENAAKTYIVNSCGDGNVQMKQTDTDHVTIDCVMAKSGDHAFGGCYDLTSQTGTFAAKDLAVGDTVIAFFDTVDETVGSTNYLRDAYVISAAADPE